MPFNQLIIVLGKRLSCDQLTLEGKSRVTALAKYVLENDCSNTIVSFCGGVTANQSVSEARSMYEYFRHQLSERHLNSIGAILLEEQSTNTVENVLHLSQVIIESGLITHGSRIPVRLISNDYHLNRLIEIQTHLDEQGLLKLLVARCKVKGLALSIPYDVSQHIAVPYPYNTLQGHAFLALDELTTYRVYLEGVVNEAFERPLALVRKVPFDIALDAIARLHEYAVTDGDEFMLLSIKRIEDAVGTTTPECKPKLLREKLRCLHKTLTTLNRYLDPENTHNLPKVVCS
ncbi:YdcF family protein [Vibrio methylphosphonaticus]|uniref:YdcF family protein n=1 Tax=Vibrio methylphosphonaticus TaxID=2946866 RepID=UPI00202A4956|nr:YdcF family protein [Vibrio methylphosphonaticus]MCL9777208.1 YdcF family protein [Vibrio methylphosphonaticus]